MNIEITAVTQAKVTINGQALAREYAESILLPLMVAAQGKNSPAILKVAQAFATAGLSLKTVPAANGAYQTHLAEQAQLEARRKAEAEADYQRCRVPTAQEIAEKKAKRLREAQAVREHAERIRSQMGR